MNYLSQKKNQELAKTITEEYKKIGDEFSSFQRKSELNCLTGCGKCCFKKDIHCTPIELLPMALDALERGEADDLYEKALKSEDERCLFLDVQDEKNFKARCSRYELRPVICRTFGVSARNGKNGRIDFSVCKLIKEEQSKKYQELLDLNHLNDAINMPYIDQSHRRLSVIDPRFLEETYPINKAFRLILEKVLLAEAYRKQSED